MTARQHAYSRLAATCPFSSCVMQRNLFQMRSIFCKLCSYAYIARIIFHVFVNSLDCHIVEIEVFGPGEGENRFHVKTVRKNPAKSGVVTGNATYSSFLSSLLGTYSCLVNPVISILDWNDNLAAMFEAKLTFWCQSLSIVYVGAVDTILPGMYCTEV